VRLSEVEAAAEGGNALRALEVARRHPALWWVHGSA
jgi:hypothetical protein